MLIYSRKYTSNNLLYRHPPSWSVTTIIISSELLLEGKTNGSKDTKILRGRPSNVSILQYSRYMYDQETPYHHVYKPVCFIGSCSPFVNLRISFQGPRNAQALLISNTVSTPDWPTLFRTASTPKSNGTGGHEEWLHDQNILFMMRYAWLPLYFEAIANCPRESVHTDLAHHGLADWHLALVANGLHLSTWQGAPKAAKMTIALIG